MDRTPTPPHDGDEPNDGPPAPDSAPDDILPATDAESREIIPLEDNIPETPPVDIDERDSGSPSVEPIELPGGEERGDSVDDQIDEYQPLPFTGDYHDDDTVAPDPYNVDDQVDLHLPRPTRDADEEVDDASTGEELAVDTAPGLRTPPPSSDRIRYEETDEPAGERVYVGTPDEAAPDPDHEPVNLESDVFTMDDTTDTPPIADSYAGESESTEPPVDEPKPAPDSERPVEEAEPAPVGAPTGTTTCPVCGRQTDALRFCGYCGTALTKTRPELTATTLPGRAQERVEQVLAPLGQWTRPGGVRFIMAAGGVLALLALLANNGALALMISAAILPLILVFWAVEHDVFDHEPIPLLAGLGLAGTLVGAVLGWLGSLIVAATWFDTGVLNYGAAGLGGAFAKTAGAPPFLVWTLVGIVFPLVGLAAIIGVPLAIRQTLSLRNEVMDGLTLGTIMGAGISLGSAIVFAAPMLTNGGPASDASTWTLTVIGLTILRPLVWTLCGGLLGAATWRYLRSGRIGGSLVPALIGTAGVLIFTFISLELGRRGLWYEILWGTLVAVVIGLFHMRAVHRAVAADRATLGSDDRRLVCPHCDQVTPAGPYCAHCGRELPAT